MIRFLSRILLSAALLLTPVLAHADDVAPAPPPAAPAASAPEAPSAAATQPVEIPAATTPAAPMLPQDLSPWGMFLSADPVVKAVMIGLLLASVATWTVWFAKTLELGAAKRRERAGVAALSASPSLGAAAKQLGDGDGPVAVMVREAIEERQLSEETASGTLERIRIRLERREMAARRRAGRFVGILATIGATAPFVGLFGTVWGIMNSFLGIAKSHTTNLAVVAPGIAEALLATAAGLVAAIPAVVIYNFIARSITDYRATLGDASAEILRLASRDLDGGRVKLSEAAE
jgi:biopolymer transport protein ExbB